MSTAAPATLSEIAIYQQQAGMTQGVIRANTAGLTQKDSLVQPQPEGNCLNFIVGHVVNVYDKVLPLVGQEPVMGSAVARYERGSRPITDPAEALQLSDLLAAFDTQTERFQAGLATLTPEALERPMPGPDSGGELTETTRSLLGTILFHQAYHAGQTGVLRRIAGKPGAIP
ncbi:DinB family protein [Longimicrobium sp.]|uniref:DinB family protein n=1 Tax=Longimicrobium sp. TaxID=2029185 RepID=UPI003B3A7881